MVWYGDRPEYVENDDAFDGRHINQLAINLKSDGLMQVLARPTEHHLAQTNLKVDTFIVQPVSHTSFNTYFPTMPLRLTQVLVCCLFDQAYWPNSVEVTCMFSVAVLGQRRGGGVQVPPQFFHRLPIIATHSSPALSARGAAPQCFG